MKAARGSSLSLKRIVGAASAAASKIVVRVLVEITNESWIEAQRVLGLPGLLER